MRRIILLIFLMHCFIFNIAQNLVKKDSLFLRTESNKEYVAVDQFGKKYTSFDLQRNNKQIKRAGSSPSDPVIAGIFRLFFQDDQTGIKGFHDDTPSGSTTLGQMRQNVFAQVCKDLSVLIGPIAENPSFQPDIEPKDGDVDKKYIDLSVIATNQSSGCASSLMLLDNKFPSISPTIMQEYIQTGIDPLFDGTLTPHYHGVFSVNFNNTKGYHIDLSSPAIDKYDLYTILLHELIHSLGFSSNIGLQNNEYNQKLTRFSVWDTFLKDEKGNLLIEKSEDYTISKINSTINLNDFCVLNPIKKLYFDDGTNLTQVYTGDQIISGTSTYRQGSSFTHLGASNSNDFVMGFQINPGVNKRYLSPIEIDVLRAIGYSLNQQNNEINYGDGNAYLCWGNSINNTYLENVIYNTNNTIAYNTQSIINTLSPRYVVGVDDYLSFGLNNTGSIYMVDAGNSITIPQNTTLISNDFNATKISNFNEYVYSYYNFDGSFLATSNPQTSEYFTLIDNGNSFIYKPQKNEIDHYRLFGYIPVSSSGIKGKQALIRIRVNAIPQKADGCNLVVNNDFEETNQPRNDGQDDRYDSYDLDIVGWKSIVITPDLYVTNDEGYDHGNSHNSILNRTNYTGIGGSKYQFPTIKSEAAIGQLKSLSLEKDLYTIRFKSHYSYNGIARIYVSTKIPAFNTSYLINESVEKIFEGIPSEEPSIYYDFFSMNSDYRYIIIEAEAKQGYPFYYGYCSFDDIIVELSDNFQIKTDISSSSVKQNGENIAYLNIELDKRCIKQKYGLNIKLNIPPNIKIINSNGYFDEKGKQIKAITGLTSKDNTITIPIVLTSSEIGLKTIDVNYTYYTCSNYPIVKSTSLSFNVLPDNSSVWEEYMINGASGTTASGQPFNIQKVGPLNTQAILDEVTQNPNLYVDMTEQQQTITATKKLYGDGCWAAISAQNAWYVLGFGTEYVTAPTYTLVSTTNDVNTSPYQMWHATGDLTAANSISSISTVDLKAENTITLKDGFWAHQGSATHAFIVTCASLTPKSYNEESDNNIGSNESDSNNEKTEKSAPLCTLFPNPTKGMFTVRSSEIIENIRIVSLSGIEIYSRKVGQAEANFDLSAYSNGSYIVKVILKNKTLEYLLIKQ